MTTGLVIFAVAMLFMKGPIVGAQPARSATRGQKIAFLRRGAVFVGVEATAIIGAILGAYFIGRRARAEYRELSLRNMQELIEATLREHGGKSDEHSQ